jgi:hypothetical protein
VGASPGILHLAELVLEQCFELGSSKGLVRIRRKALWILRRRAHNWITL